MRQFKKKTIALILASVVTVVGAYGAEYFKNSLMAVKFDTGSNGAVNMTMFTKRDGLSNFTTQKRDANTYVIMLPETNSQLNKQPDLGNNISSIDVKTMPYTTNSKGYTKITIRTYPNIALQTKTSLFIADKQTSGQEEQKQAESNLAGRNTQNNNAPVNIRDSVRQFEQTDEQKQAQNSPNSAEADIFLEMQKKQQQKPVATQSQTKTEIQTKTQPKTETSAAEPEFSHEEFVDENTKSSSNIVTLLLGFSLVIVIAAYLFVRAKNQMRSILGEQLDVDVTDEEAAKKKKKKEEEKKKKKEKLQINSLSKAVKKLDKNYPKTTPVQLNTSEYSSSTSTQEQDFEEDEPQTIVDLDELFQEKQQEKIEQEKTASPEEFTNAALEDFLNTYTFDDEEISLKVRQEDENSYDEELYNKYISDENLEFSKDDVEKINELLNSEITDDTLNNIQEFAKAVPEKEKGLSKQEILQNFVTTYSIDQNITFTKDDIEALNKIISVELDNDFITDLKTDPELIKTKEQEIVQNSDKPHKTSELLTLNVKDMLPDLSEALKNQRGKKIESEVKPEVVYYSEGYDVSVLSLKDKLPDLSIEINNKDAYKSRPSDYVDLVESGYEVATMSIDNELPDLEDVRKHPEKYEKPEEKPAVVDADALLKNISNVTFKPFYDGSEQFEVINKDIQEESPSVADVQGEFDQFGDIEIIKEEENDNKDSTQNDDYDDFEALYDNNYVDFDKPLDFKEEEEQSKQEENSSDKTLDKELDKMIEQDIVLPKLQKRTSSKPAQKRNDDANTLLEYIQEKQQEREAKAKISQEEIKVTEEKVPAQVVEKTPISEKTSCIIDNEVFTILNHSEFTDKMGCYLAKNSDGYSVLGYIGDKIFKIKRYDKLNSEKIQVRVSEKLESGATRYLVRLGIHKFVLNVTDDNMEFVMDLC